MFDIERLLGNMLGGSALGRAASSMGSGLGSVNGGIGAGISKGALGVGALGVAWAAFEHFKGQKAQAASSAAAGMPPPAPGSGAMPPPPPPAMLAMPVASAPENNREADATHLIRAMIAAANADGTIDGDERSKILERALTAGLSPQTQAFLLAQIATPAPLTEIVSQTREGLKRETYAASLMAVSNDSDAESAYLGALAAGLGLTAADAEQIRISLGTG